MELFAVVLTTVLLSGQFSSSTSHCDINQISKMSFEIVEDFIKKAKEILPDYVATLTNTSESCSKAKASVYLQMAQKLISEANGMPQTCSKDETQIANIIKSKDKKRVTSTTEANFPMPQDCTDVMQTGHNKSGVYTIRPNSDQFQNSSLDVFCDMETDGGGWLVIQRRGNFTPQEDFLRGWNDYKKGFGKITRDFWIGNDILFVLTHQYNYSIRFDLGDVEGKKQYALYSSFSVEDEASKYKMHITGFSGTAYNAMHMNDQVDFSTRDRNNGGQEVGRCLSEPYLGGWWYGYNCGTVNLNGLYKPGEYSVSSNIWSNTDFDTGLLTTEMKIKRN